MAKTSTCPDVNHLSRLATGDLPPEEMEPLLDHLQECAACLARAQAASTRDTLADLVARVKPLSSVPQDPLLASVIERLSSLGQTPLPGVAPPGPPAVQDDRTELPLSAASAAGLAGVIPGIMPSAADATQGLPPRQGDQETLDFLRPAQQPDELGRLGPYRILKKLGAGGMGLVFLAEDTLLHRKVALKTLLPQFAVNASARERFLREARSAASIEHEHIVPIFQVGEDNHVPFLAMPLLKGKPLDVRIEREGKLPLAEALRIAREMAEGLASAHASNLIHRDVKPSNVWLEGQHAKVKLLDFGLARAEDDTTHLTQTGVLVGTPAYMAPEQARSEQVDGRADLFSLGCVLYLMLTGERPFKGKDTMSVLMSLALENPTMPTTLIPEVPAAVSDLTMCLLAKDAADRPANAQAVVDAVRALETRDVTQVLVKPRARVAAPQQKNAAPRRRAPILVGIGVAAALLLLSGGGWLFQILIVRDRDGNEIARIKVPDGAKAEIIPDGKPNTASLDPDRRAAEYVLSIGGTVKVNEQNRAITAATELPQGAFRLTGVDLADNKQVTDVGLSHFKGCKGLTGLSLARTSERVSDEGLANFKNCKGLTFLDLRVTNVGDAGLAHFKDCKGLTVLDLRHTTVTDAGLADFKDCKGLTVLNLGNARQVSDAGLAHFKDCKALQTLDLAATKVSDAGLIHFKDCKGLTALRLDFTQVGDTGLAHFKNSRDLTWLTLKKTTVTAATIEELKKVLPQCKIEWDGGVLGPR